MTVRHAQAEWVGTLREGSGTMKFGAFEGPYSFPSRFEEANGTNPEELIGAAHAGCYSMALSGGLTREGFTPDSILTAAHVYLEKTAAGFSITRIELVCEAVVPGIDEKTFQEIAQATKEGCPVSRALTGVEIALVATLKT
jgi:lipoyl-dependent peroxiredoxin